MPKNSTNRKQLAMLVVLASLCAGLVYWNFLAPSEPGAEVRLSAAPASPSETIGGGNPQTAVAPSGGQPEQQRRNAAGGGNLDPTLRLDLLEASRAVKYEGNTRNIFELYTPPPRPPEASPLAPSPQTPALSPATPVPAAPPIPLKFYGIAQPPGSSQKKAFLTDEEEIFIGQEEDVVAKFYKIIRIGVNTIELEDIRTRQRQQLPLIEE